MLKKIILSVLLLSFVVTGCSEDKDKEKVKVETKGSLQEISSKEAMKKLDNKEDFILIVGSSTCGNCIDFKKLIESFIVDYPVDFYEVVIDNEEVKMDDEGKEYRPDFLELQERIGDIDSTPTTFFFENGEIEDIFLGSKGYDDLKTLLKEKGILNGRQKKIENLTAKSSVEVMEMLDAQEDMILVVGSNSCGSCKRYRDTLAAYLPNHKDVSMIEIVIENEESITDENGKVIRPDYERLKERIGMGNGTPSTFILRGGQVIDTKLGALDENELQEWLLANGLVS